MEAPNLVAFHDDDVGEDQDETFVQQQNDNNNNNHHGIMMSQDCVAWNEGSGSRNPRMLQHSSLGSTRSKMMQQYRSVFSDSRNQFNNPSSSSGTTRKHPPKGQQQQQQQQQSKQEIDSIFSLLGTTNGNQQQQRVLPPLLNNRNLNNAGQSSAADHHHFPAPKHKQNQKNAVKQRMQRHSYPPSSSSNNKGNSINRNRKRPDSCAMMANNRHEKLPKRSVSQPPPSTSSSSSSSSSSMKGVTAVIRRGCAISPVPIEGGRSNPQQQQNKGTKNPSSAAHQQHQQQQKLCGFADLLNAVETPGGASTTTSEESSSGGGKGSSYKSSNSEEGSCNKSTAVAAKACNTNNLIQASQMALHIKPQALSNQAFLQAKQNKENVGMRRNINNGQQTLLSNDVSGDKSGKQREHPCSMLIPLQNSNPCSSSRLHPMKQNQQDHVSIQQTSCLPSIRPDVKFPPTAAVAVAELPKQEDTTQQQRSSSATQGINKKKAVLAADEFGEDDDEFGDFELSEQDFANVDSLVAATQIMDQPTSGNPERKVPSPASTKSITPSPSISASSTTVQVQALEQQNSNNNLSQPRASKYQKQQEAVMNPDVCFSRENPLSAAAQTTIKAKPPDIGGEDDEDDPFGDFPDNIDYEAIENAAIATLTQQPSADKPDANHHAQPGPIGNKRAETYSDETSLLSFTRYKVLRVETDTTAWTKTLYVKAWESSMLDEQNNERQALHKGSSMGERPNKEDHNDDVRIDSSAASGVLVLHGAWYFLAAEDGDILHLCSLTGRFQTGPSALPIILHTDPQPGNDYDDLVPIVHPEMLAIPTTVTETLDCERRAVLKHRLGSSMSSSQALLLGTMRHSLFEAAVREEMTIDEARQQIRTIVKSEAERLVGCKMKSGDGERELLKFWPQVQAFKRHHFATSENSGRLTTLCGITGKPETEFGVAAVKGVEEEVTAAPLGLKGNIDVLVEAITAPLEGECGVKPKTKSLMSIELKTHHTANPRTAHFAQLAYYTAMVLSRHGHTPSQFMAKNPLACDPVAAAMLLYINNDTIKPLHVAPNLCDIKSLLQQRNTFCSQAKQAARPRGVELCYEKENDSNAPRILISKEAPPAVLPELQPIDKCSRCFSARECMLYAASGSQDDDASRSHKEILEQYTRHLSQKELDYFRKWDRLIDLEADATQQSVAEAWLEKSEKRERRTSKSISSLVYKKEASLTSSGEDISVAFVHFRRSEAATLRTPLSNLQLQKGSYITCSTDATTLEVSSVTCGSVKRPSARTKKPPFRHQMKLFRGVVERFEDNDEIVLRTSEGSISLLDDLLARFHASNGNSKQLHFRLDCDDSYSQIGTLRRNLLDFLTKDREKPNKDESNLISLQTAKRLSRLRELVIRLEPPVYVQGQAENMFNPPSDARPVPGCDPIDLALAFNDMNGDQKAAVQKVASMQDYSLIQGYPGSGKSSTIVYIARLLASQGKRVLITSYTHSAVDNCLLKLIACDVHASDPKRRPPCMVRIGDKSSVHDGVQSLLVSKLASELEVTCNPGKSDEMGQPSAEALRRVINDARIVGVTALKVPKSPLLVGQHFDVVIVDEAGQINQPVLLGALAAADSFVLVGDHMQLPPLVQSEAALEGGYGESMLSRLAEAHPLAVAQLTLQYRMHSELCALSSQAIYNGTLRCGVDVPRLNLPGYPRKLSTFGISNQWLKTVLNPYRPLFFTDTDGIAKNAQTKSIQPLERTVSRQSGGNMVNDAEAALVNLIIQALLACGARPNAIGVICPFNAQIRLLGDCPQLQKLKTEGLEINTIDKYQGRDKDIIILSLVRSNPKGKVGRLLQDKRRVNVAITRAKKKMILIGSASTLSNSPTLKLIIDQIQKQGRLVALPPGAVHVSSAAASKRGLFPRNNNQ